MEGSFLLGLLEVIFINILLSGDNAVVIALACRNLPKDVQRKAVFWGTFGAIAFRAILTIITVWLMKIQFIQAVGAVLLVWIAINLLKGEDHSEELTGESNIWGAVKTIVIADLVMSLDNVVAVAAAAKGDYVLIGIGLAISIPLIIWGSQLLMKLMSRFPIIITIGAALLGYTAGEMILMDKAIGGFLESHFPPSAYVVPIVGIALVLIVGKLRSRNRHNKQQTSPE